MINNILKKINLPNFVQKISLKQWLKRKPQNEVRQKHLSLQTIYTYEKQMALITDIDIKKQYEILSSLPDFALSTFNTYTAQKNMKLIGLAKHARTLLKGVILYDLAILASEEWEMLSKLAIKNQSGIGVFQVKQSVPCLQITNLAETTRYLIDHRVIKLIEWLQQI